MLIHLEPGINSRSIHDTDINRGYWKAVGEGEERSQAADLQRLRTLAVKFMLYKS